jgi:hypothetical protein
MHRAHRAASDDRQIVTCGKMCDAAEQALSIAISAFL